MSRRVRRALRWHGTVEKDPSLARGIISIRPGPEEEEVTDPKASDPEEEVVVAVKVVDMPSMICQEAIDPQQEVVVAVKVVDMPSKIWDGGNGRDPS